jgi:predicted ABC-type ATPase
MLQRYDKFALLPKCFAKYLALSEIMPIFASGMSKNLYIISGCNGAGKTTASYTVLPEILDCKEFVNADEIARGLSPFNPESVAIEAGRLMLLRIEELLEHEESFAIETTLATKSYINLVRKTQAKGYIVRVLFFWLNSPELALRRVAERVSKGGHNIPEPIIRRRYVSGIRNLFNLFMGEVDYWELYDNSAYPAVQVAFGGKEEKIVVKVNSVFNIIKGYVK